MDGKPKAKEWVHNRPALHDGIPLKEESRHEKVLRERKTRQHASPLKRVIVHKEMLVITGIHLSVVFITMGIANLGACVEKAGGEAKKQKHSVVAEDKNHFAKIHCEERHSARGVSYFSEFFFRT